MIEHLQDHDHKRHELRVRLATQYGQPKGCEPTKLQDVCPKNCSMELAQAYYSAWIAWYRLLLNQNLV